MLKLCFLLFVVSITSANVPNVDQAVLQDVFGSPEAFKPLNSQQAPVVAPPVSNDPEYLDSDDFYNPSPFDFDKFDWTLTKRIAAFSEENFLLSPLGLKLALALLNEAATGPTQAELSSVLGFEQDKTNAKRKFSAILNSLRTNSTEYILNLNSQIYLDHHIKPQQAFAAVAKDFYRTDVAQIDFSNPALAAKQINQWVYNNTEGRIKDLVNEDEVNGIIVFILNTLFFKGSWRHQFAPNATKVQPFFVTPKIYKPLPFMHTTNKFYYADSNKFDAKILRMPYLGSKFSMVIVVPNSLSGLQRVWNSISEIRGELYYLREKLVDVRIPKFQFDYTSLLDGVLKEMGIRLLFEDAASLPGIARGQQLQQRLKVSKVLQRSGIDVNELGSIAYSATEISLVNKFGEDADSKQEIIANKPFLFFIEDEGTRQLLFTGRVADPAVANGAFNNV